ncbi:FAD-dependent oxidoreductase [Billgrantia gudaonensis]|uniref:Rubredoxin-NAD+ reductase n=1 Tax=Billgrantia gudaonensis TaxID=376427 RepID=A0A1G8P9A8_9GAMM|nr:FAD-dependent oxidoreductase [Halomonas gudaonensis]SDI89131.1 rubredoxin-NAD+ reductase [Halomonas gudaonensis]
MTVPLTIVGSGMAGLGLVRQLRALKDDRPITVITADSGDGYSKPLLSTGFAKGLPPERLAMQSALEVAEQLKVVMRCHTRVEAIDLQSRTLRIGAERLPWGELVLATGASPAMPFRVPPALGDRVFQINDLDDYRAFHGVLEALGRPARVAIVGFGLVGCEFANDLTAGGHRVALVAPEEAPLPRLLPAPLGRALGDAFSEAGMSLYSGRSVAGFFRQGADVGVALDDGNQLDADLVLVATGLRPRTALAEAAGLPTGPAGIHVDRTLTAVPGVHALGDVACVDGVNAMYVQPLQACAKALAQTLAGTPTDVVFGAWPVLVKTPLLPVVALPPAEPPARWRLEGEGQDWVALAEDQDERLIGFALTGRCVRRKVELARAAPALLG